MRNDPQDLESEPSGPATTGTHPRNVRVFQKVNIHRENVSCDQCYGDTTSAMATQLPVEQGIRELYCYNKATGARICEATRHN